MKSIRSLFLWGIGFIYFGFFSTILILLSYLMPLRKLDPILRTALKILFKILFVKVEVEGNPDLNESKTYLLMSNHVSLFDVPLLKAYIPVYFKGVEAHHQFKWPFYGWLIKRLGTIPIRRDSFFASMKSLEKASTELENGISIAILPEGSRTISGKLRPFKKMPFKLAKKANLDIVPIGLSGLFKLKPKISWHITPSKITINFGDPITAVEIQDLTLEELRQKVREKIVSLVNED